MGDEAVIEMAYALEQLCNEFLLELEETGLAHPVRLGRILREIREQSTYMEEWL